MFNAHRVTLQGPGLSVQRGGSALPGRGCTQSLSVRTSARQRGKSETNPFRQDTAWLQPTRTSVTGLSESVAYKVKQRQEQKKTKPKTQQSSIGRFKPCVALRGERSPLWAFFFFFYMANSFGVPFLFFFFFSNHSSFFIPRSLGAVLPLL